MPPSFQNLIPVLAIVLAGCGEDLSKGEPVADNCGFETSAGNEVGVGKFCQESADCPEIPGGAVLQCSTVLVDNTLPLMCSRPCDLGAADAGCGTGAVCTNIKDLGFDLNVCVSLTCQPLFSEPLQ